MDANGSRYHALIGKADWTACLTGEPGERDVEWNGEALTLEAQVFRFQAAAGRDLGSEEVGRGGVFDAYGNLYSLAADRRGLRIRSSGSGRLGEFWPVAGAAPGPHDGVGAIEGLNGGSRLQAAGDFQAEPAAAPVIPLLDAIAITTGHYLVAASRAAAGLLIFDLHGGGPPLFQTWPALAGGIDGLIALADGGIGVLAGNRLLCTGADLKPCLAAPRTKPTFAPKAPADAPLLDADQSATTNPCTYDLSAALPDVADARISAIARLAGCRLLVLAQAASQPGRLWLAALATDGSAIPLRPAASLGAGERTRLPAAIEAAIRLGHEAPEAPLAPVLEPVADPAPTLELAARIGEVTVDGAEPTLAGRALAIDHGASARAVEADDADAPFSFLVVAAGGDQAYRFVGEWQDGELAVAVVREFLPLRRYEGMGLAALPAGMKLHAYPDTRVFYATAPAWAPLLAQAQPRYPRAARLDSPAWDSGIPGCVWHRLLLDLRLPPGTRVSAFSRSGETPETLQRADWQAEPALLRVAGGNDLPWRDPGEMPDGSWETLLQAAPGRWLQIRLEITGDGRQTPSLKALRVWYPRFSYAREYLPPIFRADAGSADFLDRLLALFEGEFTRWEDRIAAAQWLFDARTAPAESLEWLAGWLGLAFDAAADERRKRLLIRHAMLGHARRGTVPGMLLGATLAWEEEIKEAWLQAPEQLAERPHGLRLQEFFGLARPLPADAWRPAAGRSALLARLDGDASLLVPAGEASGNGGRSAAFLHALGFVPRAAAEEARLWAAWNAAAIAAGRRTDSEPLPTDTPDDAAAWRDYLAKSAPCAPLRQRWQDFLARRWRRVSALNEAWGARWPAFAQIPSPLLLPAAEAALADWHRFESQVVRGLAGAHRFRIVLPLPAGELDLDALNRRRAAVWRVVERDKPAHTTAEVRFGFDLFRIGEARLGLDTRLEAGLARRPGLAALSAGNSAFAPALLGQTGLGEARLAPLKPQPPVDRVGLDRD